MQLSSEELLFDRLSCFPVLRLSRSGLVSFLFGGTPGTVMKDNILIKPDGHIA